MKILIIVFVLLSLVNIESHAQTDVTEGSSIVTIEEIVVTARKREESLLDIPETVVAISGETISQHNMKTLDKIGMTVPNFNLNTRTDGWPNVTMRGMGAFSLTQGVGFYLDDVQLFGDASSRFGDLDRIEILKGPQGVLYGGSNIGGAIKFISTRPSPDAVSGNIKIMVGEQSSRDVEGSINVPFGDGWAARLFAFTREDDGFMYNPTKDDESVAGYEESGGRLSVAGPISDNLSLYASIRSNQYDGPNNNWAMERGTPPNFEYPFINDIDTKSNNDKETFGAHLELVWELDGYDVTSITSYTDTEAKRLTDVDLQPELWLDARQDETFETTTQEIRLTSTTDSNLQWQAGLYTSNMEWVERATTRFGPGTFICFCDLTVPAKQDNTETSHLAAFGNLTYTTGLWEIGFGLRVDSWEREKIVPANVTESGLAHVNKVDGTEVLPRLSISRSLENDSMVYLTVAKGYEPGGLRHEPVIFDGQGKPSLSTFNKEEAIQTEIGWKGTFMEGRGHFSMAAFMIDYEDRLFTTIVQSATGPFESIDNSGNSENIGFELELAYQATEFLTLAAAFGTLDAEWDSGTMVSGVDVGGTTPSGSIDNGIALAANYAKPLDNGMEFVADFQFNRRGSSTSMPPHNAIDNPSYDTINLTTGI
ncbi:MAG: TonB-dependent receptor plug domain-containing protein, partial [Pseudomonadota bacterium]|nr:TonB-dependent receptor plug domain-containing protein [Pseudomonadota bacterium]